MNAHGDQTWTMTRFLEWAFGPRSLFETAKLVHEAVLLVEAVITRPDDLAPRRALQLRLIVLRDLADGHLWHDEGNVAATLIRTLRGADHPFELSRRLRAGLVALEEAIRSRLASAVLLQIKQGMRPAA